MLHVHVYSSICESLRSLVHCNCVDSFALTRLLCACVNGKIFHQAHNASYINTRMLRLCVRLKVHFLLSPFPIVSVAIFGSLFSLVSIYHALFEFISIDYRALELNWFEFESLYLLSFLFFFSSVSRLRGLFDYIFQHRELGDIPGTWGKIISFRAKTNFRYENRTRGDERANTFEKRLLCS